MDLATRFETARAGGEWTEAWALLSTQSQQVFGTLAGFEASESAYNASGGTVFMVEQPTNEGASYGSEGLYVAPLRSGEWRIWIVH